MCNLFYLMVVSIKVSFDFVFEIETIFEPQDGTILTKGLGQQMWSQGGEMAPGIKKVATDISE